MTAFGNRNFGSNKVAITWTMYARSDSQAVMKHEVITVQIVADSNSVETKKVQRFEETIKSYHNFVDSFGRSGRLKDAENYYLSSLKELEKLKKQ